MADAIKPTDKTGGQSIPSALAATPASKKPRVKAPAPVAAPAVPAVLKTAKPAKPAPAPVVAKGAKPVLPPAIVPPVVAALAPAPKPVEAAPAPETVVAPEPVAAPAPEPVVAAEPVPAPAAPDPAAAAPELAPVSLPTAAVPAAPQKESIMATTIENVTNSTAKAQAFFTDANERAKGAVAKSTKMFEEATAFGKGNVEALVESSKIAAKGFESMGQDVAEFSRKQFEEATAALKTLASAKSPTEFLKLHSDFVRQSFDSLVAETSRSTEQVLKLAGEVAQPLSNRVAVAAEKLKPAA